MFTQRSSMVFGYGNLSRKVYLSHEKTHGIEPVVNSLGSAV